MEITFDKPSGILDYAKPDGYYFPSSGYITRKIRYFTSYQDSPMDKPVSNSTKWRMLVSLARQMRCYGYLPYRFLCDERVFLETNTVRVIRTIEGFYVGKKLCKSGKLYLVAKVAHLRIRTF